MTNDQSAPLSQEEIEERGATFEVVSPLLDAMYREMATLSAKKPEAVVNPLKIKAANRLLIDALSLLNGEPSRQYLETLEEDSVPQYSDVVLIIGQFKTALGSFRKRYFHFDAGWLSEIDVEEKLEVDDEL